MWWAQRRKKGSKSDLDYKTDSGKVSSTKSGAFPLFGKRSWYIRNNRGRDASKEAVSRLLETEELGD